MAKKKVFMGNTSIEATKTIGEISAYLVDAGASGIQQQYESGQLVAVAFSLPIADKHVQFMLPARIEPMFRTLQEQRSPRNRAKMEDVDRAQAVRVAWRQILRWVQAQLALIDTQMVEPHEVFMPYLVCNRQGKTLFEAFRDKGLKALPMLSGE